MNNRFIFLFITFYGILGTTYGQDNKLPQIQQKSFWMENFEADGKLEEWQQPLQAYNKDTHTAHSIANDDTYLYLAVKSNRTSKIFLGGVGLILERKGKSDLEVIYPYNPSHDMSTDELVIKAFSDPKAPKKISDLDKIQVKGLLANDSIIPMLNEQGILAAISEEMGESEIYENGERHYVVEMALPLAYLKGMNTESSDLNYRIRLRGVNLFVVAGQTGRMPIPPGLKNDREINYETAKAAEQTSPTEFKGVYRLANNPNN